MVCLLARLSPHHPPVIYNYFHCFKNIRQDPCYVQVDVAGLFLANIRFSFDTKDDTANQPRHAHQEILDTVSLIFKPLGMKYQGRLKFF